MTNCVADNNFVFKAGYLPVRNNADTAQYIGATAWDNFRWREPTTGITLNGFDPDFLDKANHDFHLLEGSGLIDAGVDLAHVTSDYDGNSRPVGASTDIGPFEGESEFNNPPTITAIADQNILVDTSTGSIGFTIDDVEDAEVDLTLGKSSSNTALILNASVVLGGSGANRTVTCTPESGQTGTATITITVTDSGGEMASRQFLLTVTSSAPSNRPGRPNRRRF
jgi:hypothetical protein